MKTRDPFESEILGAYEKGELKSIGRSKTELKTFRDAARATLIKNRRVNIRLSSPDLMDIQPRYVDRRFLARRREGNQPQHPLACARRRVGRVY